MKTKVYIGLIFSGAFIFLLGLTGRIFKVSDSQNAVTVVTSTPILTATSFAIRIETLAIPTRTPSFRSSESDGRPTKPALFSSTPEIKTRFVYSRDRDLFSILLKGNEKIASELFQIFLSSGRKENLKGFFTYYHSPGLMTAYRTEYNESACIIAVPARFEKDRNVVMHIALVKPEKPEEMPPFFVYVGDLGLLESVQLAWDVHHPDKAVQVKYGGEPVAADFPVHCFLSHVNSNGKTSWGSIYILNTEETLWFLRQLNEKYR